MKKYISLILVALLGWLVVESFKQRFRILPNKKFTSNLEYYENFNIFKCISKCRKEADCKIFNYNSKQRICQLTNQRIDVDHQEATESHGWKVYIPIMNQVNCQNVLSIYWSLTFEKEFLLETVWDCVLGSASPYFWVFPISFSPGAKTPWSLDLRGKRGRSGKFCDSFPFQDLAGSKIAWFLIKLEDILDVEGVSIFSLIYFR